MNHSLQAMNLATHCLELTWSRKTRASSLFFCIPDLSLDSFVETRHIVMAVGFEIEGHAQGFQQISLRH
jgi:hypothetical protein